MNAATMATAIQRPHANLACLIGARTVVDFAAAVKAFA
jgi:hypothetical protein